MEHSDLVAELPRIHKLTAAERLKMARERRCNQLRFYEQHERQFSSKINKSMINQRMKHMRTKNRNVRFIHSVMLLEAAARNDIEEGTRYYYFTPLSPFSPTKHNETKQNTTQKARKKGRKNERKNERKKERKWGGGREITMIMTQLMNKFQ